MTVNRILVCADERDVTTSVWQQACSLGVLLGAEVIPIHVTMDDAERLPDLSAHLSESLTGPKGLKRGEIHLYRPGFSVAEAILAAARDHSADMILLGAGKKSTLDRVFLGSTAEGVDRMAKVPVFIVRPGHATETFETILCAVDSSPAGQLVLRASLELARLAKSKLICLSVVDEEANQGGGPDPRLAMEYELRDKLMNEPTDGVDVWVEVLSGKDPAAEILDHAESTSCDLLVLGQAGRTGLQRLWNANTAEALMRKVPCSMLTIPQDTNE